MANLRVFLNRTGKYEVVNVEQIVSFKEIPVLDADKEVVQIGLVEITTTNGNVIVQGTVMLLFAFFKSKSESFENFYETNY